MNDFQYSELDLEEICKWFDNNSQLIKVRAQIQKALENNPKNITLAAALKQIKSFRKV